MKFLLKQMVKPAVFHMLKQLLVGQLGAKGFATQMLLKSTKGLGTGHVGKHLDAFLKYFVRSFAKYVPHHAWEKNHNTLQAQECLQSLLNVAQTWTQPDMVTRLSAALTKNNVGLNRIRLTVCVSMHILSNILCCFVVAGQTMESSLSTKLG